MKLQESHIIHHSTIIPTSEAYTMKSSMPADKHRRPQASNAYNVFFTLERLRLIDTTTDASTCDNSETNQLQESYDLDGYESLALPDLPPRYQHLQLPMGWFVPGKSSKRKKRTKSKNECELYDSLTLYSLATIVPALSCNPFRIRPVI